ncbi:hypothetical protein CEB3_c25770 [Peptococcaceae bacterium CEB3]|nr:hypothetical protein CEB3_c25770 [Peptococcaceae bacterium CEB3]
MIMERKGVCYDVGRHFSVDWRKDYNLQTIHRELEIIKNDLHCNAVRICGRDIRRLTEASEDALRQDLEVWFSPELWNKSPEDTLDYTAKAAEVAEQLRKRYPNQIVMSVGTELTLFMKGIIEGRSFRSRIRNVLRGNIVKYGKHNKPLNDYLSNVVKAVRQVYDGPITYASLPFERVDWEPFDFIGIDHYRAKHINDKYADMLELLIAQGKPVAVMEFGCCSYQGAERDTAQASNIMDIKSTIMHQIPLLGRFVKPCLNGRYVRDEELQAHEIIESLNVFDSVGVDSAFVCTFVAPLTPYNENPLHDLDMASYSLVKFYEGGGHGTTYPDMTWEPKESFAAVAKYYCER